VAGLLDVNVLVAIVVPEHEHHDLALAALRRSAAKTSFICCREATRSRRPRRPPAPRD
jgi:predicted nucleic acid-binding protein